MQQDAIDCATQALEKSRRAAAYWLHSYLCRSYDKFRLKDESQSTGNVFLFAPTARSRRVVFQNTNDPRKILHTAESELRQVKCSSADEQAENCLQTPSCRVLNPALSGLLRQTPGTTSRRTSRRSSRRSRQKVQPDVARGCRPQLRLVRISTVWNELRRCGRN